MAGAGTDLRIAHNAVEAAIRALAGTTLKPQSDSMLRVFLAFRSISANGQVSDRISMRLRTVVEERFTLLPTPDHLSDDQYFGTIALRGSKGRPSWLNNETYRGSFLDYAGPTSPGRFLFEEDEGWRRPLRPNAAELVANTIGGPRNHWPPGDALAIIALRNEIFPHAYGWPELIDLARQRFGVTPEEWALVTSTPAIEIHPFVGRPWDPEQLAPDLLPSTHGGLASPNLLAVGEERDAALPPHLADQVERVVDALDKHSTRAIVALAGVPGTSKSHVARLAAQEFASEGCLREIQFSPGYTYEEFMEGPRYAEGMEVKVVPGAFLELNKRAIDDPQGQYVLLIEELTRADLPRVLGELLTYVEYRGESDCFTTMYERGETRRIAPNIAILATYNPSDRSAVNLDAALIRRMRILDFPPSIQLLQEILSGNGVGADAIAQLAAMFDACRDAAGERFAEAMPFGHAVFAAVREEQDLHELWHEELVRMLVRPHAPRHELYDTIADNYPWREHPDS